MAPVHPPRGCGWVELDDGHGRPRTLDPTAVALPPHYRPGVPVVSADDVYPFATVESHWERVRLGARLWWARHREVNPPMSAADVRRTLGMSAHTLTAVEFGPGWPSVTSIVRVAALFDMTLTLVPAATAQQQPPWPMPESP